MRSKLRIRLTREFALEAERYHAYGILFLLLISCFQQGSWCCYLILDARCWILDDHLNLPINQNVIEYRESTTTRKAGGLDFRAKAGKTKARQCFIVVVKKTCCYTHVFFYNHLCHSECFFERRYKRCGCNPPQADLKTTNQDSGKISIEMAKFQRGTRYDGLVLQTKTYFKA